MDCTDNARKYRSGIDTEAWILDYNHTETLDDQGVCIDDIMYRVNGHKTRSQVASIHRIRDW